TSRLTLGEIDELLEQVAHSTGSGSTKRRQELLTRLFTSATNDEQRFLVGLLLGELRQGALEGVLLDAVALASGVPLVELRRALLVRGDLAQVATTALVCGAAGLSEFRLTLFQALSPMLAQPAEDPAALLATGPMRAEYKLDGARIQVHKRGNDVRVYSRQLNDVTGAVPEVVTLVESLAPQQLILDG